MEATEFPLTQEFVAMMLGATRQTVTVVAGELQKAGLITYQRGKIRDRQPQGPRSGVVRVLQGVGESAAGGVARRPGSQSRAK